VHHRQHPDADRLKDGQLQQVESCGSQFDHRPFAITSVAVSDFMELGVPDPVSALNNPAFSYQFQHCFWGGAQAREKQMSGTEGLAVRGTGGRHSTIQLVPLQASRMCVGACFARSDQVMLWPCLIS